MNQDMNQKNKYLLYAPILFFLMFIFLSVNVSAAMPNIITSADQYYSVIYDGKGEAMVFLRISLTNTDNSSINKITLEIPGNYLSVITVMQEKSGYTYTDYPYYKLSFETQKLSNSVVVPITLENQLETGQQTFILVMYKIGYAKNFLGVWNFNFESAKLDYTTNNIRIAINTQQDLILKGGNSNVNYQPTISLMNNVFSAAKAESMSRDDYANVQNAADYIMYAQGFVKSNNYLSAHESMNVEGQYSKSWFALYWYNALFTLIVITAFIMLIIYIIKKINKNKSVSGHSNSAISLKKKNKNNSSNNSVFLLSSLSGLFGALAIVVLWTITILIISITQRSTGYLHDLIAIILVLLSIFTSLAILIGLPMYNSTKYGMKSSLITIIAILLWLFVFTLICIVITAILSQPLIYY